MKKIKKILVFGGVFVIVFSILFSLYVFLFGPTPEYEMELTLCENAAYKKLAVGQHVRIDQVYKDQVKKLADECMKKKHIQYSLVR